MADAEYAGPATAALRSGMWSFLRFRQRKRQPVCHLWRKGLVYKGGTTSGVMKHLFGAHATQLQVRW